MKKFIYILIFLMALLLAACGREIKPEFNSTTAPTGIPTVPSAPTDPTVALTPSNIANNANLIPGDTYDVWAFQKYFNESPWYNRALSCSFGNSVAISMEHFFNNGLDEEDMQDNSTFTNEERAYLHGKWCEKYGATPWVDAVKMPVKKLNEALAVLNITVKDIKLPEDWVYYDKTDSYYAHIVKTDPISVKDIIVTKVVRNGSTVQVYWMTNEPYRDIATNEVFVYGVKMVTTLKRLSFNGGQNFSYVIVSNLPGVYTPLTFAELSTPEDFAEFIKQEWWCWRAMGCTFEKPENISLEHYFYMGLENDESKPYVPLTKEEQARIDAAYKAKFGREPYTGETRLPVEGVKEALSFLGVTLEDVKIPDIWLYDDKTASYYCWKSDAYGLVGQAVIEVVKNTDGTVKVYWESEYGIWNTATQRSYPDGTKMVMTMQAMPDGGYRILSNLPVQ